MVSMATYYTRLKRQILSRVYLKRGLFVVVGSLFIVGLFGFLVNTVKPAWELVQMKPISTVGRTNILILGAGGGDHEGGDLTDAMAVVSIGTSPVDVAIISIPRDLWVASLRTKINALYYYGEQKQAGGGGFVLAKSGTSEITGLPIHYAVLLDFSGFEKTVDYLGGIDVDVERSFVDREYPIAGRENDPCIACRYETVSFVLGKTHMDGATALKFVRSRHSEGDEGSDYARSKRQDQVTAALRAKILSNPWKIYGLYKMASKFVTTDIPTNFYPAFAKMALTAYKTPIRTTQISDLLESPAILPLYDYQWVLVPRSGSWQDVWAYIKNFLAVGDSK